MRKRDVFICGGDYEHIQPRSECPNPLHDYPLPYGYVEASEVAQARLSARWRNRQCPDCKLYGWAPGRLTPNTHATKVKVDHA